MEESASAKQWIDQVVEHLDPASIDARPEALEAFARELLSRASAEVLERRGPDEIADDIDGLFGFVETSGPEGLGVNVQRLEDRSHRILVETVMPDCAFIVNTLRAYVHGADFNILHLLHPVLVFEWEGERIVEVHDRSAAGLRTSVVYMVLDGHLDPDQVEEMESEIRSRLRQVRLATSDFRPMVERLQETVDELDEEKERVSWRQTELEEIQEFLRWLEDDSFVFLGYRTYDILREDGGLKVQVRHGSGLGILREEQESHYAEARRIDELPPDLRSRAVGGPVLIVSKTNAESPVHRQARMDYVGVKRLGPDAEVTGERRFLGLFTAKAYAQDASTIPILRRKLREILEAEEAVKGSHDYNRIVQVFNSMPKEELFLASVPELLNVIGTVMETEGADEVRVVSRSDPLARGVNVIVMLPRDRFSEGVRRQVRDILLEVFDAEVLNYHLTMNGGDQARLHFYLASERTEPSAVDLEAIESEVRRSVRSWEERLSDELEQSHDAERAHRLADRHRQDFSTEYKATVDVHEAVEDIERLESLETTGVQQLAFEEVSPERPEASLVKVFAPRGMYVLSDLLPILENLGLRVIEADKYDIGPAMEPVRTIHTFEVEAPADWDVDRERAEPRLEETFRAIEERRAEDDRLNSLVLSAELDWREVALLRAYAGYAFRIGAVSSRAGVRSALAEHPRVARTLLGVFQARLDPSIDEGRGRRVRRAREAFHDSLDSVASIEHDRACRRLLNLVESTVRTNFYQRRARERPEGLVALKFRCDRLEILPEPRPMYEVYVSGARTEGAHLRMDRVARGGIRWSDRSEDFRVEVLSLVKTQQIKNSVIVPAGAKGGYIVKSPPQEREALKKAGDASYREFIRGLLDLTDNIVDGEVVHPAETVVLDEDDPYLVVAADKGTAHQSDAANELAQEYDFWLGDAFASGGSHGYDHKELGITARGAWECVKRHFREMGLDVQQEPFAVVGIGDMSGDVFGNGMLLSRQIKLVAAFDHRHVFVDPDPDPETSWEERRRLFEDPGSTWMDYDRSVLSEGGGVYDRGAKEIDLSDEARALLGVEEKVVNGESLIRTVLRSDVDLLWNGGIGTYVKGSSETHGEVGDPGNDDVRVDAADLRVDVVGEGGNLGFTQAGRVEYALGGGRINTDALDNSGGVDMSDREVNLKILFREAVEEGRMDLAERNGVLREITDDVADRVLRNNYTQSLAVTLDEHRVREVPAEFRDVLTHLEREGVLDRQLAGLPTTEELLERQEGGRYLTRPELGVLLAYAKTHLQEHLEASRLVEDPALEELVRAYVPERAREAASEASLRGHRLHGRIVATELTNLLVDRMGAASHVELLRETGQGPADVAKAWYSAYRLGDADRLYRGLWELDNRIPAGVQTRSFLRISEVLERTTRWLLLNAGSDRILAELLDRYGKPVSRLRAALPKLLAGERREELASLRALHETDGLPTKLAAEFASFQYLDGLLPVAEVARARNLDARRVGEVYFGLAEEIDFPWLQQQLARIPGDDLWEQRAAKTLSLDLEAARTRMSANLVKTADREEFERPLGAFRERYGEELGRIRKVLTEIQTLDAPGLAALMVVVHAIQSQPLARSDRQ